MKDLTDFRAPRPNTRARAAQCGVTKLARFGSQHPRVSTLPPVHQQTRARRSGERSGALPCRVQQMPDLNESLRTWVLNKSLRLMVPSSAVGQSLGEVEQTPSVPAVAYFSSDEVLQWHLWLGLDMSPEITQKLASITGLPYTRGYASWLSRRALKVPSLILRETTRHTGTRIWAASWLHRAWALSNPSIFEREGMRVHEMGAGCGKGQRTSNPGSLSTTDVQCRRALCLSARAGAQGSLACPSLPHMACM